MLTFGRLKPSFMILGVQKGGTTSLHDYLIQHPKILGPKKKELHFFDSCKLLKLSAYHDNFPNRIVSNKISFESTPRYLYYPGTAEKLKNYNSNLKFIVVLRDPVKRAFSAWNMYKQMIEKPHMRRFFFENENKCSQERLYTYFIDEKFPNFLEWVTFEIGLKPLESKKIIEPSIVRRGYYKDQIIHYLKYFELSQFMFINSDDLLNMTKNVLTEVFDFLNLEMIDLNKIDLSIKHKREYSEHIDPISKKLLNAHYKIKNEGLEELIGKTLNWN
ncbi:sulfotransferase domain-containing protein [Psychroserpens sp. MEBiC05023]